MRTEDEGDDGIIIEETVEGIIIDEQREDDHFLVEDKEGIVDEETDETV